MRDVCVGARVCCLCVSVSGAYVCLCISLLALRVLVLVLCASIQCLCVWTHARGVCTSSFVCRSFFNNAHGAQYSMQSRSAWTQVIC